jgi:hypothetical protein
MIRSGVFDLKERDISADEYKAVWAFIAAGVGTVATIVGFLLTSAHNQRTLAFQEDIEARKTVAQTEVDKRLALDTAIRGLELIGSEGKYAPPATIAGALATLVHLGHPVIAMRTLDAAWDDGAVDAATGCWLIGQVFQEGSKESMLEAARLLRTHARGLCGSETELGVYEWPYGIYDHWPHQLPLGARINVLHSLLDLLLSRGRAWWRKSWNWIIVLMFLALRSDQDQALKASIGYILPPLLDAYTQLSSRFVAFQLGSEQVSLNEIRDKAAESSYPLTYGEITSRRAELESWATEKGIAIDWSTLGQEK